MSGRVTGWVLQHGPRPEHIDRDGMPYGNARARTMRAVLAPIADSANSDGTHSHPGKAAIVDQSLYSLGTVKRVLRDLVAEGWIRVDVEGGGRGLATEFSVLMDRAPKGGHPEPVDDLETGPSSIEKGGQTVLETGPSSAKGGRPDDPPTSLTTTASTGNDSTATGVDVVAAFEAFWATYPRRSGKGQARKAFVTALAKVLVVDEIIDGAFRYATDPNRDPQYTKLPATWLNGECWGDDPLPPRGGRGGGRPTGPIDDDRAGTGGRLKL